MTRAGVCASSRLATEAGIAIAAAGGNAVDAAVAAALVSLTTEVAFVSPGASGFVAIWPADGEPTLLDAYAEVPGRGLSGGRRVLGPAARHATVDGSTTLVGYDSIATPGAFAGLARAAELHGRLPWKALVQPALRWAEEGFPLSSSGETYYEDAGDEIFGWHPESRSILVRPDGGRLRAGDTVRIPGLARSLRTIAEEGVSSFYGGALGNTIADDVVAGGGHLTRDDLAAYEVVAREPLRVRLGDWELALNPPPAVGGTLLAAILLSLAEAPPRDWGPEEVRRLVRIQETVLGFGREHLHGAAETEAAARRLLASVGYRAPRRDTGSPSTVHTSSVDADGLACAVTLSDGYCSGVLVPGTGMWMNNSLGELELLPRGAPLPPPGTRLVSNMAPTVARRRDGAVLAIGSPGSGRIPTSIAQVLLHLLHRDLPLTEALAAPRLHVDVFGEAPTVVHEAGLPAAWIGDRERREVPDQNLYFGSVQVARWSPEDGLAGAADPRRDAVYGAHDA